jgi:hypothetical protein
MRRFSILLLTGLIGLAPTLACADAPKAIDTFGDWAAYASGAPKPTNCYVSGKPAKSEPKAAKRGEVFLQVSFRKASGGEPAATNEVSYLAGYPYKKDSDAELAVGGMKVALFTEGDGAWAKDANTDAQIVAALKQGKSAMVKGTSAKGTVTTDTFALTGFDKALAAVMKACAVKPAP